MSYSKGSERGYEDGDQAAFYNYYKDLADRGDIEAQRIIHAIHEQDAQSLEQAEELRRRDQAK